MKINKKVFQDLKTLFGFKWMWADWVCIPSQTYVLKWFREVRKIKILVTHSPSGMYNFEIYKWNFDNQAGLWERIGNMTHYDTYELAEEAGIKKTIEILKS